MLSVKTGAHLAAELGWAWSSVAVAFDLVALCTQAC
jgi:hypothetical protein